MIHVFIVNPKVAPRGYASKLREQLSQVENLNYYVLSTREAGYETELVKMMENIFEGEQLRFYCCGGSGTAKNMLQGMSYLDREELAIIPLGRVDYLNAFVNREDFLDPIAQINGTVTHVDYIKTNNGVALNSVSTGMDTFDLEAVRNLRGFAAFGKNVPYRIGQAYSELFAPNRAYDLYVNEEHFYQKCGQITLANMSVLAGNIFYTTDRDVADGLATCLIVPAMTPIRKGSFRRKLHELGKGIDDGTSGVRLIPATTMRLRRRNGAPFNVNMDGELVWASDWQIEVVKQGLRFVVPRRTEND